MVCLLHDNSSYRVMTSLLYVCYTSVKLKTESLCCRPETNILSINHTLIKQECVSPQKNHRMLKEIIVSPLGWALGFPGCLERGKTKQPKQVGPEPALATTASVLLEAFKESKGAQCHVYSDMFSLH